MSDTTTAPGGVLTPARTRTLAATLAGAVLALIGTLANGGGETGVQITTSPHPGTVAQIAAVEHRLAAVERAIADAAALATDLAALRARLDLVLEGARVKLDGGEEKPPRSRR